MHLARAATPERPAFAATAPVVPAMDKLEPTVMQAVARGNARIPRTARPANERDRLNRSASEVAAVQTQNAVCDSEALIPERLPPVMPPAGAKHRQRGVNLHA